MHLLDCCGLICLTADIFQDKTTATVHDSTDDLWFVEEESFAVEVNSDGKFSVEYDVESEKSQLSESDISSIKSGEVNINVQWVVGSVNSLLFS